jgi:hypothetical protein
VLHEGAKYGLAGQIVDELSQYTEASDAGVLFSLLAGFGAMLGRTPYIQAGSRQSARLWPLLVGPTSSGRKGTSWQVASMPLWYADRGAFITRNVHSGLSTGEGLIHLVRDGEEPDPAFPRKKLDEGVIDKRRLIVEQEFAGRVLAVSRRENSTLSSVLREAWEGSTLEVSTRTRPQRATAPHVVLICHATATELRTRLSDSDFSGGLVNRFLIVGVKRSKLLPSGELPPDDLLKALGMELGERLRTARDGPKRLSRTEDASKLWETLYRDILNADDDDETPFGQAVTRGPAYVARLSLVYAVLDGSPVVDVPHVTAAALAWDYCYSSAKQIFQSTAPLGEGDDVARAEAYIRACNGKGVTRSQLSALFRRGKSSAELDGLTKQLIATGNVAYGELPDKSRHPTLIWVGSFQISEDRAHSRSP